MNTEQLTENRRRWSEGLRQAEWWLAEARKEAKRRDYRKSRNSVLMACGFLDEACQYETMPTPEGVAE